MKMLAQPMSITDWAQIAAVKHPGETGFALWKTQNFGDIRVRMVEYSPGYAADHWCAKGHVILCLSGTLDIQLQGSKQLRLEAGQSYQVGDGDPPHRSSTAGGAQLFIVD
ncbi:MAG TPA: DHCW motif cupin fold protein [Candidatus Limnocylindrales bacterium]|jgi:quercetin dioxygenase-like cupin family protein|nr:DHCW motif cupin fold protein [Candidatus Limnocylindrales bacterium]